MSESMDGEQEHRRRRLDLDGTSSSVEEVRGDDGIEMSCHGTRTVRLVERDGPNVEGRSCIVAVFLPSNRRGERRDGGQGDESSTTAGGAAVASSSSSLAREQGCDQSSTSPTNPTDQTSTTVDRLDIMLTDGEYTYRGSVPASQVKGAGGAPKLHGSALDAAKATTSPIRRVKQFLLSSDSDSRGVCSVIYEHCHGDIENKSRIKVSIKEKVVTGRGGGSMVKIVWTGYLVRVADPDLGVVDPTRATKSVMPFVKALASSVNSLRDEISSLQEENLQKNACLQEWQNTAQSLDGELERRQSELLDNFLVLLNRTKSDLRKAKKELEEERKRKRVAVVEQPPAIRAEEPLAVRNADERGEGHDFEEFGEDLVNQLAEGRSLKRRGDVGRHGNAISNVTSMASSVSGSNTSVKATKKNMYTGAIEMWDAQDAFAGGDEDHNNVANGTETEGGNATRGRGSDEERRSRKRQRHTDSAHRVL